MKILIKNILQHKASQSFIIISSIAVLQLINNVYLGRKLSKEDYGLYSFIFLNVIRLFSILFLFGQTASVVRYFSSKKIENYLWKKYFLILIVIIIIPLLIASYFVCYYYKLNFIWFWFLFLGSFLLLILFLLAAFFRASGKFNRAMFFERGHPLVFFLLLASTFFFNRELVLKDTGYFKIISLSIVIPVLIYVFYKWKQGSEKIEKKLYYDGIALWELSLAVIVLLRADAFFITKLLSFSQMALFSVVASVMQIYEFSFSSLISVYSQKFAKNKDIDFIKILKLLIIIIIIISSFYLLFTKPILFLLFKDKYQASFLLIFLFCLVGSMNILYVLPSCFIIGHSNKKEMRIMSFVNIISLIIKIILIYQLYSFGLVGFLIAGIIAMSFRTLAGYVLIYRAHKKVKN